MNLVFVYGTLKRGYENHGFLNGQTFVSEARTAPGYALYDLAGYPGMVRKDDAPGGVVGELWLVDDECLAQLDILECTAEGLYRREPVPLQDAPAGQRVEAYIYLQGVKDRSSIGTEWLQ
jgi:gamma-glutamylcyclotransferase (GGCT)/AIG2-like uncharacterized protein YtfP